MSLPQLQDIIITSSDEEQPNVTLVSVDNKRIKVHKSKVTHFSKLFSDELTEKQKVSINNERTY